MAHEAQHSAAMSYVDEASGERCNLALKLPKTQQDWHDKRAYVDAQLNEVGGVVVRVGDETIGELWSLWDGKAVLDEIDPRFSQNVERHIMRALTLDPFHVSANTDPKGDRSKRPQEQDPDMLLHVVKETDAGIVVRGAKYETAAAYANQAFVKPTIAQLGRRQAVGLRGRVHRRHGLARHEAHLPHRFRRTRASRGLSAVQPVRRSGHADRVRRRAGAVGERAVLPAHARRDVHPCDAASLFGVPLHAAHPVSRRHADRRGAVQCAPDRAWTSSRRCARSWPNSSAIARASTRI